MPRDHPTEYARAKARHWGKPVPDRLSHGPNTMACKCYGCDCKLCLPSGRRKWMNADRPGPLSGRERRRRSRNNLYGQPVPPRTKHGIYARKVYGCRCETCMEASRRASHRAKNPWMYREDLHGRWRERMTSAGPVDVLCWPPADAGPDWKCTCQERQEMEAA